LLVLFVVVVVVVAMVMAQGDEFHFISFQ